MPGGGYHAHFLPGSGPQGTRVRDRHHFRGASVKRRPVRCSPAPAPNPCTNISADIQNAADLTLPPDLDVVWTSENYHDLHNANFGKPDMKAFDAAIFKALKPGGVFIVEDPCSRYRFRRADTETLHRIDPDLVKQEVTSAGFVFEDANEALHNDDDTHEAKVFDLKGRSDKFLFKFRKPKGSLAVVASAVVAPAVVAPAVVALHGRGAPGTEACDGLEDHR